MGEEVGFYEGEGFWVELGVVQIVAYEIVGQVHGEDLVDGDWELIRDGLGGAEGFGARGEVPEGGGEE